MLQPRPRGTEMIDDPDGSIFLSPERESGECPTIDELSTAFLSLRFDPDEILDFVAAAFPDQYYRITDSWRFGILQSRTGSGVAAEADVAAQAAHYEAILARDV